MQIERIDGVEETFDVNFNKYELERIYLAIRYAVPYLTASPSFDSITVSSLLDIHNKIMQYMRDDDGAIRVPVMGVKNSTQELLDQLGIKL